MKREKREMDFKEYTSTRKRCKKRERKLKGRFWINGYY